jgi:hypothetical protein
MQTRWVTIGTVREKFITFRNWGVPDGVAIHWRGTSREQEFFRWEHLFSLLQERTKLSGLVLVAIASNAKRGFYGDATLRVLFARRPARAAASSQNSPHVLGATPKLPDTFFVPPVKVHSERQSLEHYSR